MKRRDRSQAIASAGAPQMFQIEDRRILGLLEELIDRGPVQDRRSRERQALAVGFEDA